MGFLEDPFEELRAINTYMARRERAKWVAQSTPPDRVARLNEAAERFPFLTADAAMGAVRSNSPLAAETFAMLGELSTRRWMRDHPSGIAYGERVVKPAMRQSSNRAALANQAIQYATGQAERAAGLIEPIDISDEEVERRVAEFTEAQRSSTDPRVSEDERRRIETFRENLERSRVQFRERIEPAAETGGGPGLIANLQRATGTAPTGPAGVQQAGLVEEGLTGAVRTGAMALDLPVQEFQGQVRNLYGWAHGKDVDWTQPQSDLLISLQEGLDPGNGFLVNPESDVAQERRRREAERGQISGHNITLGRWVADATPFAADSKPWMMMSGLVDLGVQVADPSAFVLGKAGKLGKARRLFANPEVYERAGLWAGVRRSIAGPDAAKFLDSKDGVKATEWLTNSHSPYEVWRGLNRKVNFDLATEIADTRSLPETRAILERTLGPVIREQATVKNVGFGTDPLTGARLGLTQAARRGQPTEMPIRGPIDATDKDVVGHEIESWLYNVKGMDDATVERIVSRVARTQSTPELNATIRDALRDADGILAKEGITDPVLRSELVRLHEEASEESSKTWFDAATRQGQSDDIVNVGGDEVWDASAHLYIEHAPRYLKLPDPRAIRRVQSRFRHILTPQTGERAGQLRMPLAAIEAIQGEIWKPVVLATRIAWPVRVIGEEQIRMAVAGYDSMFNHPVSFIAGRIGKKQGTDIKGDLLSEATEHKAITVQSHGGWIERAARTGHKKTYHKSPHEMKPYKRAWASEIVRLANDPVAQRVATSRSLEDAKTWFTRGGGTKFRGELAQMHPGRFDQLEQADSYIESVARRINQHTGANPDLLDAVRTGKFRGRNVLDGSQLDQGFVKDLDGLIDEFGPDQIVGDEWLSLKGGGLAGLVQTWDRTVDRMFGLLMSERTNNLSRSPTFRQAYWKEAERLIGWADEPTRQSILRQARAANLDRGDIRRMEGMAAGGELNLDEVDLLAKGHALDTTKELLYDLSRKGRTMDAWRVVFPFGEAWSEVITRWFGTGRGTQPLGLLWQNPKTIRRFQQLMQGARGEEFGEFMGAPDGQGFFWKNQWGEEVFMWPGTAQLTDKLLGVEMPLTSRVQGLSMFGTVMPGLGPVAQVPVGWLAQSKPGPQAFKEAMAKGLGFELGPFGTVQEQILPFGAEGAEDASALFSAWTYAPPWVRAAGTAIFAGDLNGKQWNQAVMEVAGSLKATGDYGDSLGEQNRLYEDAADKARWFYVIKALAATTAPSAPDGEWMIENHKGQTVRAAALSDELRKMREEDFDTADARFLEKYGPDVMAVLSTPMTTSSVYAVPSTREGVDWVMANPGVEDRLPNVYGFFAPEGGDEDFTLYSAQFRKGQAIRLNPEDWIRLLNHTKGNVEYAKYVEEVGDKENTKAGRIYLDERREEIYDRYPGWRDERGKLSKAPDRTFIDELYRAASDRSVRGTDAGQGLARYLELRDEVVAWADEKGLAWPGTAKGTLAGRIYLDEQAQEIIAEHPGFKRVYDFILSRETEELEEVTGG